MYSFHEATAPAVAAVRVAHQFNHKHHRRFECIMTTDQLVLLFHDEGTFSFWFFYLFSFPLFICIGPFPFLIPKTNETLFDTFSFVFVSRLYTDTVLHQPVMKMTLKTMLHPYSMIMKSICNIWQLVNVFKNSLVAFHHAKNEINPMQTTIPVKPK